MLNLVDFNLKLRKINIFIFIILKLYFFIFDLFRHDLNFRIYEILLLFTILILFSQLLKVFNLFTSSFHFCGIFDVDVIVWKIDGIIINTHAFRNLIFTYLSWNHFRSLHGLQFSSRSSLLLVVFPFLEFEWVVIIFCVSHLFIIIIIWRTKFIRIIIVCPL